MNKYSKDLSDWTQIVIRDPQALPGKSIYDLIDIISRAKKISHVIVYNLEGAGTILLPKDLNTPVLSLDEFMKRVSLVTQFDWGDFFLFNHDPSCESYSDKGFEEIIPCTETTVKAVDDTYLYVYTSKPEIISAIQDKYSFKSMQTGDKSEVSYIESMQSSKLIELEYPD